MSRAWQNRMDQKRTGSNVLDKELDLLGVVVMIRVWHVAWSEATLPLEDIDAQKEETKARLKGDAESLS